MTKYFHIIDKKECVDLLNIKEEEITFLKSTNMGMEVYGDVEKMMDYKKEYLNLVKKYEKISELFDEKIEALENDVERADKAGMPSSTLYEELVELKNLKEEIMELWYR